MACAARTASPSSAGAKGLSRTPPAARRTGINTVFIDDRAPFALGFSLV
jgi:proline racemase